MKVLHRRCAGLDVHKAEVVACARVFAGRKVVHEVRRFGTTTRDLTRTRRQAVSEAVRHQHRIEKILQDANIKLSSVLSDPMGVSGRRMLAAMAAGETDAGKIAELGSPRLECGRGALIEALSGRVSEHHRYLIGWHLRLLDEIEAKIAELDQRIEAQIAPFRAAIERLTGIPGIKQVAASAIIAEIGADLSIFPT